MQVTDGWAKPGSHGHRPCSKFDKYILGMDNLIIETDQKAIGYIFRKNIT
jgi:hypothetical protein